MRRQAGLNTWVGVRSAAGADDRADRRAAEDQTADSHVRANPSGGFGVLAAPLLCCGAVWRIGRPGGATARGQQRERTHRDPVSPAGKTNARRGQSPPVPRAHIWAALIRRNCGGPPVSRLRTRELVEPLSTRAGQTWVTPPTPGAS